MAAIEIVTADSDTAFEEFARIDAEAFSGALEQSRRWAGALRGQVTVRLATRAGRAVGTYVIGPTVQRFGGRDVVAAPVCTVAVTPDARGLGVGAALMADLGTVCRDQGIALAPLWAALPRFYRRHGWGVGDRAYRHFVRIDALASFRGLGEPVRDPGPEVWKPIWAEYTRDYDGSLVAPAWMLADDAPPDAGEHRYSLGWREDAGFTGYVEFTQRRSGHAPMETEIGRFAALTGDAHRGLLGVLAGGAGQGEEVVFPGGRLPLRNVLHQLLPDPHRQMLRTEGRFVWMQRIVDVAAALAQRGWEERGAGRISLNVADADGGAPQAFNLEVDAGTATVAAGTSNAGTVHLALAALASWYCGGLHATEAGRMGLMRGPRASLELMDKLLPHRPLWLNEQF
jgi:predicted acetyltransferase